MVSSDPISIPNDSIIALGIRTPWLFPQRFKVVFIVVRIYLRIYKSNRNFRPNSHPETGVNPASRAALRSLGRFTSRKRNAARWPSP